MHEVSLAGGILRIVEDCAARERFERVTLLRLSAPALAGVEVRALRFALESMAPGTALEGARVEIDEPPGQAWCLDCGCGVEIPARGQPCPRCGGYKLQVTGGTELKVIDLLVA
ncbi:hydrogenase maturation nickel metallochaperone HypA [Rubrivivax gelatinosus]|uniref:Hydrogenase maturation factor HypA n=1 Tax=Rubrivivax gelatinosus TaxID=28068 RepID=A0ABS1DVP3_RUBGE|nr:hydrogenase maturation nickel metallochaperone HypA [Rubrivivax gelatinosus]MBK1615131.1 hydrogenase maturation nickel metallochaperone HypA [Rubrivivax gelatinosus]MBK1713729.1 hydrogenase maturation nickel metallochaperone HypA [Rubrivivax gelatinosus]